MPPESLWVQFSLIGILILVISLVWRELTRFIREQDGQRIAERETQRAWQAEQDKIRDERWQGFLRSMQDEWIKQDGRNNQTIADLIERIEELIERMDKHDQFTREAIAAMRERTGHTGPLPPLRTE